MSEHWFDLLCPGMRHVHHHLPQVDQLHPGEQVVQGHLDEENLDKQAHVWKWRLLPQGEEKDISEHEGIQPKDRER